MVQVNPTRTTTTAQAWLAHPDLPSFAALLAREASALLGERVVVHWWNDGQSGAQAFPAHGAAAPGGRAHALATAAAPEGTGMRLELDAASGTASSSSLEDWLAAVRPFVDNALEKAALSRQAERLRNSEAVQRALFEISDLASAGIEMRDMLRRLHAVIGRLMYADNFFIALHDPEREVVRFIYFVDTAEEAWQSPDLEEEPLEALRHSLTWYLLTDARPLRGPTATLAAEVSGPLQIVGPHSADWLGVPMIGDGRVRGVMVVQNYDTYPCYSEEDQAVLSFMGSHILTALDRRQAVHTLEREVARRTRALSEEVAERERGERLQATLFRIAELSQTATGLDQFYAAVHAAVSEVITSDNFYIALLGDDGNLHFPYFVDELYPTPAPRPPGIGVTEYVLRNQRPLLADLTTGAGRRQVDALRRRGELDDKAGPTRCWLGVPLVCDEKTVGVLAVQSYRSGTCYDRRDQELLTFIGYQIAHGLQRQRAAASLKDAYAGLERRVAERTRELREQIAERERIEQRLQHEVLHDALTGLPNRAYLREHLERAMARRERDRQHRFAVLFMDLDRFKVINDSAGHLVGDQLLAEVARRFSCCVRAPDLVARLGGDEFAVLMDEITGDDAPVRLAQRLIARLREPVVVAGRDLFTSASIGIVVSNPRYRRADELLRDADIAMYRAKANGRQQFEVFDEELHRQATDQLRLEGELRRAVERGEFEPFFQPIVRLADGAVIGYEALLRWRHPTRGRLAPGEFLYAAEAGGLLETIDWCMYELTCRAASALLGPGQYVNVNVSPRHLRTADFDRKLLALLAEHNIAPAQLRIEVTEWALMDDPVRVGEMLDRLRAAGVVAALDDFGTGHSSLGSLHRLSLAAVKIDRVFVEALRPGNGATASAAVADAVLTLGRALGLDVVAEGIETAAQRDALLELGCELGQGFLFSRPMPLAHWCGGLREAAGD
jgi:diguanylate cyclase (GGDEF)-like protein